MKKIDRILVWFNTEQGKRMDLLERFYGLCFLYNSLINLNYVGPKIKFLNINLCTQSYFEKYNEMEKNTFTLYNGHFNYHGIFDLSYFENLNFSEQSFYLWDEIKKIINESAIKLNNNSLLESSNYAFEKGLFMNLNTDYKVLEAVFKKDFLEYIVNVVISFKEHMMSSKLIIMSQSLIVYELQLDETFLGNEFFLVMYTKIEIIDDVIVLKGKKDVEYLPLKININDVI